MKLLGYIWIMLVTALPVSAQTARFRVMEYNVENLFDCRHDSLKDDYEFLPDGSNRWTYRKYQDKLTKLAKVIVAAGEGQLPDLVALCEVENDRTLRDLTRYSILREAGYSYVMTDSPDERGIDVALLYQRGRFKLLGRQSFRLPKNEKNGRATRDILHVTGLLPSRDTLDVLVCHLPSQVGGKRMTSDYRILVAGRVHEVCDSLMSARSEARILITGDFNDGLSDGVVRESLGIRSLGEEISKQAFYNLMEGKQPGTYRYRGEWNLLDHVIVSGRLLLREGGVYTTCEDAAVVCFPFLLEPDRKFGGMKPFRTHIGPRYNGGFSDHLPICVDLHLPEQPFKK